jgi:hypothetical protein
MVLNYATNATATPGFTWDTDDHEGDGAFWRAIPTFFIEGYVFGGSNLLSGGPIFGADNHMLTVNMDTCQLQETFALQNNSAPYHFGNGATWDLTSNNLRNNKFIMWSGNNGDPTGLTSADAAGLAIWPGVLTYAELFSGQPITHAIRITYHPFPGLGLGFVWPGTHGCDVNCNTNLPPMGSRWRLKASFDTTTCHFGDCIGLAWPSYMQRLLTAMQTYGVICSDGGTTVGLITDTDQNWGDPNSGGSANSQLATYLHGVQWQDGEIVAMGDHIVTITSGQTK